VDSGQHAALVTFIFDMSFNIQVHVCAACSVNLLITGGNGTYTNLRTRTRG